MFPSMIPSPLLPTLMFTSLTTPFMNTWVIYQVLFANDTVLVADSEGLQQLVMEFGRVCDKRKLKVNVGKSKVMRCTRSENGGKLSICIE